MFSSTRKYGWLIRVWKLIRKNALVYRKKQLIKRWPIKQKMLSKWESDIFRSANQIQILNSIFYIGNQIRNYYLETYLLSLMDERVFKETLIK